MSEDEEIKDLAAQIREKKLLVVQAHRLTKGTKVRALSCNCFRHLVCRRQFHRMPHILTQSVDQSNLAYALPPCSNTHNRTALLCPRRRWRRARLAQTLRSTWRAWALRCAVAGRAATWMTQKRGAGPSLRGARSARTNRLQARQRSQGLLDIMVLDSDQVVPAIFGHAYSLFYSLFNTKFSMLFSSPCFAATWRRRKSRVRVFVFMWCPHTMLTVHAPALQQHQRHYPIQVGIARCVGICQACARGEQYARRRPD